MKKWLDNISKLLSRNTQRPKREPQNTALDKETLSIENRRLFDTLCQFIWIQGEPIPLILDLNEKIYQEQGINQDALKQLEACGLIHFEPGGYVKKKLGKHTRLFYCGKPTKIGFPQDMNNQLDLGHAILTERGKSLASAQTIQNNQAFYEYVIDRWYRSGYMVASIQVDQRNDRPSSVHAKDF